VFKYIKNHPIKLIQAFQLKKNNTKTHLVCSLRDMRHQVNIILSS